MGFLNETGGNLRATWGNLSPAARWGLALTAVALVASSVWWSRRTIEVPHVVLFPGQSLAPSELVAMEAAFGRARLNDARLVDGHFEVPAERKDDYVRALIDHQALPATPASFSERLIAQDNLFTSPRQRDALMKLAKEREIALMVRQIAGIAEATLHYEDVDGDGFPRRKSRRATVAVRSRSDRPLSPQLVHAIRTTVANSLGIASADAIAVLDLNEGIAYADAAASPTRSLDTAPHASPGQRATPGPTERRTTPAAPTDEHSTERTGPVKLATFDAPAATAEPPSIAKSARRTNRATNAKSPAALPFLNTPPPREVRSREIQTRDSATRDSVTHDYQSSPSRVEPSAEPSTKPTAETSTQTSAETFADSLEDPTTDSRSEPSEPRLLPKSMLRMVRPANHEELDTIGRTPQVDQPRRNATPASVPKTSDAPAPPSVKSGSRSKLTTAHWSTWLRDHGPTFGGCGAGLGIIAWLLRALLSAGWDARVTSENIRQVERFETRDDRSPAEPAVGQTVDSTDSAAVRRELADRVREDTPTAAAKLRQWLGHAA